MKPAGYLAVALALVAASFLAGKCVSDSLADRERPEVIRDTVTKVVTVYKDFPSPAKTAISGMIAVPRYMFFTETKEIEVEVPGDTVTKYVYLPREQQYYEEEDGKLRMWISGYQPVLERYEVDWPTTVITETYRPKAKHWGFGIAGGYGIALADGKPSLSPTLSIVVSYNFFTW